MPPKPTPPRAKAPPKLLSTIPIPSSSPLPLPLFLSHLSTAPSPLTFSQAITAARHLYPLYSDPASLPLLTHQRMIELGLQDEEVRKGVIKVGELKMKKGGTGKGGKGKRKGRESDLDQPLPGREIKKVRVEEDFDFEEILAEEALIKKSVVTNRAPIMTSWAIIVSERLGFRRQEALSIAQVYTSLNATSKAISLSRPNIIPNPTSLDSNAQPYVNLLGRQIPVLQNQDGEWRAIDKGEVVDPDVAYEYVKRCLRQQMGAVLGAMRLLADSYEPTELNNVGYNLYLSFRPSPPPDSETWEWGQKSEMFVSTILDLRRWLTHKGAKKPDEGTGTQTRMRKVVEGVKEEEEEGEKGEEEEKDEFDRLLDEQGDEDFDFEGLP